MKQKKEMVQIEKDLFMNCLILIYGEADDAELWEETGKRLYNKLEKMANRDLYTKYLTADNEEEKEKARQEYLNRIGIPKDFQWK